MITCAIGRMYIISNVLILSILICYRPIAIHIDYLLWLKCAIPFPTLYWMSPLKDIAACPLSKQSMFFNFITFYWLWISKEGWSTSRYAMYTMFHLGSERMGLLPDTKNCGLRMRRECRERFPRDRGLAIPTCITARACRTCRDACRDKLTSGFSWSWWRGKTFPAFPAHAQPAILRIWYEAHKGL